MQYWINIFEEIPQNKIFSIESSEKIRVNAKNNLIKDLKDKASSLKDGKYTIDLSYSKDSKPPFSAEDDVITVKKTGSEFIEI